MRNSRAAFVQIGAPPTLASNFSRMQNFLTQSGEHPPPLGHERARADARPDKVRSRVVNFADGKAGLAVVGALVSMLNCGRAQDSKPPLTGEVRANFVESAINNCLDQRDTGPDPKAVPASVFLQYCRCFADRMADHFSIDDVKTLEAMDPKDGPPAAVLATMETVAKSCMEATLRRTKPGPSDAKPPQPR